MTILAYIILGASVAYVVWFLWMSLTDRWDR